MSIWPLECGAVHNLTDVAEQCEFVSICDDCHQTDGFIPYLDIIYCMPYAPLLPLGVLCVWSLYLFGILAVTANDYLCPSLVAISKKLDLSQAVAGVTFLAIGNGAPDIIASFTAVKQGRLTLVISELFGAGIFVTTIVVGYVIYSSSFIIDQFSFTRDVAFYMLAAAIAFSMFRFGEATIYHGSCFLGIYAAYILTVLVREFFCRARNNTDGPPPTPSLNITAFDFPETECFLPDQTPTGTRRRRPSGLNVHHQNAIKQLLLQSYGQTFNGVPASPGLPIFHARTGSICSTGTTPQSMISREAFDQRRRSASTSTAGYQSIMQIRNQLDRLSSVTDSSETECGDFDELSLWKEFWIHVAPISWQELKKESTSSVILRLFAIPIQITLALTVPVVDYEHKKDNWCKSLNVINCITAPLAVSLILFKDYELFDVPVAMFALAMGMMSAGVVMMTSSCDKAPRYHFCFALLAFFTGVCFIYAACRELMAILKAVGISQHIDDSVLGLTILAWGSSIGDLITDSTVAKQGYPSMAVAAAFSGPMLNLLVGLGSGLTVRMISDSKWSIRVYCPNVLFVLYAALNGSLLVSVLFLSCNEFRSSSTHCIILMFLYVTFIITALTVTMHPDIITYARLTSD
ncbi:mitochondrial sodium/calcium exchanger protein-like [Varroa destructor]|uniref:Sodium/calcium exchanger membrane region domain-containing protein n=1 Tax=Varroa destructor TaxID=109461 RepID=A0A7M7MBQ4_VARDE|nr:mitochondrial sodium/calcium exchanger protein-like [Varroa destructor]